jgi:SAM-dependent methyltransferase
MRRLSMIVMSLVLASAALAQQPVTQPQRPGGPKLDVDFEATPPVVAKAMLDIASVGPDDTVLDLGCGEGDIANTAARLKGARAICLELDPVRIAKARENAARFGVADRVSFIEGDLFQADLTPATVVTLFLWDTINLKLRPKILDLAPGTRIVSHGHDMGDWRPDRTEWHNRRSKDGPSAVHLWVVPAKVAGAWSLSIDGETYALYLAQRYQYLSGSASAGRFTTRLRNARVDGRTVMFDLPRPKGAPVRIAGRLDGDRIVPAARDGAAPQGATPPVTFTMMRTAP